MYEKITKILSKEKSNIQNLLRTIKNIDKYQDDPLSNLYKIKHEVVKIEKMLKQSKLDDFVKENIEQHIRDIKSKIPEWEENVKKTFGQNLENELKKVGFELRGHYPLLKVSFYTLKVDLENFKVSIWYGPEQEKLETCKLVPEDIVKKLKIIHDKITQRHFNDNDFLSKVYEAYRVSLYRQNKKLGAPIPISDILFEYVFLIQDKKFKTNPIKNNYKGYGRVFFSYDLYRLKERRLNNVELNLITATRAYTRRKSDFLWIPSNEKGDGNYISHIKFRR
ncbi:MAG: hypothetical protein OD815_001317 [Candidatus Alkanophagales archaeon MCA70_species_2]|nr:hypothetical protein [Candidatus Alkanophaga liquidiphilum]